MPPLRSASDSSRGRADHPMTGVLMADLVFVVLTVVFFAVMALVLKGVERL